MSFKAAQDAVLKMVNTVFGDVITYTRATDSVETEIKGVFTNEYVDVQGVATFRPVLRIRLADLLLEPLEDDLVTINSVTYYVTDIQHDNFGGSTLILKKE